MCNVNSLPEPRSGFRIAFNMFDTDGNQRVDKNEFLVVSRFPLSSYFKQSIHRTLSSSLADSVAKSFLSKLRGKLQVISTAGQPISLTSFS